MTQIFFLLTNQRHCHHYKHSTSRLDKIIANNEHFHLNGNTLKIKNAQKHLAGYYNCIIAFGRSGAKLETPYELLVVNGKCI